MSVTPNRRTVLRGAAVAAALPMVGTLSTGSASATSGPHGTTDLGANVLVFDPSMGDAAIQAQVDAVFKIQESNQFGSERYALAFKVHPPSR